MPAIRLRRRSIPALAALAAAVAAPVLLAAAPAAAHPREDGLARELVAEVTAKGAYRHLAKFQRVADANGGNRAAGTPGHYHGAGDTLRNVDLKAFDTNLDVIAHAVGTYAEDLRSLGR